MDKEDDKIVDSSYNDRLFSDSDCVNDNPLLKFHNDAINTRIPRFTRDKRINKYGRLILKNKKIDYF